MKESQIRTEVTHLLRRLWYWPISQTDLRPVLSGQSRLLLDKLISGLMMRNSPMVKVAVGLKTALLKSVVQPPKGRPDILCLSPASHSIVVEVKTFPLPREGQGWAATSFPFSEISREQRRWLDVWQSETPVSSSNYQGGYIALGTRHGRANSKDEPRLLWLVGWPAWKALESLIIPHQNSMPLQIKPHLAKPLVSDNLTARGLLHLWEAYWSKGGWHLKTTHPLCHGERDHDEFTGKWKEWDEQHKQRS